MLSRYVGILVVVAVISLFAGCGGDRSASSRRTAKIAGAVATASLKGIEFTLQIPAAVTVETLPPFSVSPFLLYSTVNDPQFSVNPGKYGILLSAGGVLRSPGVVFTPGATSADPGTLRIVVDFPAGFGPGQALSFTCIAPDSALFSKADFPVLSSILTNTDGSTNTSLILEVSDF